MTFAKMKLIQMKTHKLYILMLRLSNRRSKSNFFLNSNWIEIDFLASIFSILTHGYIGEDNALLRVQSMTAEPWQRVLNTPTW